MCSIGDQKTMGLMIILKKEMLGLMVNSDQRKGYALPLFPHRVNRPTVDTRLKWLGRPPG
jgi:hypothetical protein